MKKKKKNKNKISKFDICGDKNRNCFNCPYQDTAYCVFDRDTPHSWIWWQSIKLTAIVSIPIIALLLIFKIL